VDEPTPASQVFNDTNIKRHSFNMQWVSLAEEYDSVEVFFINRDNFYIRDSVKLPDAGGTKTKQIHLYGITRPTHAQRECQYHLNVITQLSRFAEFECALDALAVEVGDVIYVSHEVPRWGWSGRVAAVSSSGGNHIITLDKSVDDFPTSDVTQYELLIRQRTDAIERLRLSAIGAPYVSAEGYPRRDVTVVGLFPTTPVVRDALWMLVLEGA
jgi:hypothetical protein